MVDEKALADARTGMNIDPGLGVDVLAHHPRDDRHAEAIQLVGHAMNSDGTNGRVAQDHFRVAVRGWVARVRGDHIFLQQFPDRRQPGEETPHDPLGLRLHVLDGRYALRPPILPLPAEGQSAHHLLVEGVIHHIQVAPDKDIQ